MKCDGRSIDNVAQVDGRRRSERLKSRSDLRCAAIVPNDCEAFDDEDDWSVDSDCGFAVSQEAVAGVDKKRNRDKSRAECGGERSQCDICQKRCRTAPALEKHRMGHFKRPIFQCGDCRRTFKQQRTLLAHIKSTHLAVAERRAECPLCGKLVLRLSAHVAAHNSARFRCAACPRRFRKQSHLDEHWRTHSGETPFACHICASSFRRKWSLQLHLVRHDNHRRDDGAYLPIAAWRPAAQRRRLSHREADHNGDVVQCNSRASDTADLLAYAILLGDGGAVGPIAAGRCVATEAAGDMSMSGEAWESALFSSRACDTADIDFYVALLEKLATDERL